MSSYRVPSSDVTDSQAEQFRKYLENGGVLQAVEMALVEMYQKTERPNDPLKYFKECLGVKSPDYYELENLRDEVKLLSAQLAQEKLDNQALRAKLEEIKLF